MKAWTSVPQMADCFTWTRTLVEAQLGSLDLLDLEPLLTLVYRRFH